MKYFYLVWSNLRRKKLRSFLTLLSIVVAFSLFGYLAAIRQAFNMGVDMAGADRATQGFDHPVVAGNL